MGGVRFIAGFFLAYGFLSGLAFLAILHHQVSEARAETMAAVLLQMPISSLAEFRI